MYRLRSMHGTLTLVVFAVLVGGVLQPGQTHARPAPATRVKIGKPRVMGGLPTADVHRVLISHRRALEECYEDAIQKDTTLSGQLEVHFMIGVKGIPSWAESTGGNLKNTSLAKCVLAQIKGWRFHGGCSAGGILVKCQLGFNLRRTSASSATRATADKATVEVTTSIGT
jgi:hypothetical protein